MRKDPASQKILDEIRDVKRQVAEIQGERDAVREDLKLSQNVVRLREELETLRIEKARKEEEHAREKRDTEHMVGLQKKRQEFEEDAAKREAVLDVREENLNANRDAFEKQLDFMSTRFGQEVGYLKELMTEVLGRLPTVNVDRDFVMANGHKDDDDE